MDINIQKLRKSLPDFLVNPDPAIYHSNNYVVLDFETTNIDYGSPYKSDNRIVMAAWYCGSDHPDHSGRIEVKWGTEFDMAALVDACEKADFIVAHNAKFELGWLRRCGLNIDKVLPYCTQVGEYVRAGNRSWAFKLEKSLERWGLEGKLGIISVLMEAGVCPSEMPMDLLEKYGKQDVRQTLRMFWLQRQELSCNNLLPVMLTRNIFTVPLVDIERNGMHLDKDRVLTVYRTFAAERNKLQEKLDKLTGGVNFRSGKQMAELLYRKLKFVIPLNYRKEPLVNKPSEDWPDGVPKTDKDTIAKLKAKNKVQREFLQIYTDLKKVDSSITKFIGKFADCVEQTEDGILHASMNQTVTKTHRLSSSGQDYAVQFQNFDRRFKPLFSPRHPGWFLGEADEAQLEYRTAVFLGEDEVGLNDILEGVDAHSLTASIVFKEDWEACGGDKKSPLGKARRQDSKSDTFKPLYGGKSGTERQKEYYAFFMEKHQGIADAQEGWKDEVYRTKKLRTISGLIFYWEDCKLNRHGTLIRPDGRPADQSICNYPVQSLATAEIVPIGVAFLHHYMKAAEMESFLVNTVHDSAIGEIHPDERRLFKQLAEMSMVNEVVTYLNAVYNIDFYVPLECETELNTHWSNSKYWEEEYLRVDT